jgi:hypothetical protein
MPVDRNRVSDLGERTLRFLGLFFIAFLLLQQEVRVKITTPSNKIDLGHQNV